MTRRGDWLQTYSGRQFWPLDPRPEEVDPSDIAHALSLQCRFGGHCIRFYSVAEHCVHVSRIVPPEDALWGLLHDGSEAYVTDVPRPLKRFIPGYKETEAAVMVAICERFGLPHEQPESVKRADLILLTTEARRNMAPPPELWSTDTGNAYPIELHYWAPWQAEREFWQRLLELTA